ncbi:hypothetical protein ACWEHA_40005 [Amycolatopsis nivea]
MTKKSIAAILFSVAVVAGCGGQRDPRAYPGSEDGVSWEEASARFQMTLPSCPVKEFHFDVQPRLTERLAFVASKSCVDKFLKQYGDDPANPTRLETPYHAKFAVFVKPGIEETVYARSLTSGFPDPSK